MSRIVGDIVDTGKGCEFFLGFFHAIKSFILTVVVFLFVLFYLLNLDPLVNIRVIDILILTIFIFFALKEFRDRYNRRELHFWQGMTGGVINYLTIALISSLFILVMTVIIDPDMTTKYIESRITLLNENKQQLIETIDEEAYSKTLAVH